VESIFGTARKNGKGATATGKKKKQALNRAKRQEKVDTLKHLIPPGKGNPMLKKKRRREAKAKKFEQNRLVVEQNPQPQQQHQPEATKEHCSNQQRKKKRKKSSSVSTQSAAAVTTLFGENEYLSVFNKFQENMPEEMSKIFHPDLNDTKREELFELLDLEFAEKYAWAVPSEKALRVVREFGPVVEIGAGKGYWGKLLLQGGVDYVGYDIHANDKENEFPSHCDIKQGGVAAIAKHQDRSLMLCYPDDYEDGPESMALKCLQKYKGNTVILIGELFGQTILENPWGKTCGGDFQEELAASFHLVLQLALPSFQCSVDSISVWKRTQVTYIEGTGFKCIPPEEQIPISRAAPLYQHLLS